MTMTAIHRHDPHQAPWRVASYGAGATPAELAALDAALHCVSQSGETLIPVGDIRIEVLQPPPPATTAG